jgi:hypothetical protein
VFHVITEGFRKYETDISAIESEETERPRFPKKKFDQTGARDSGSSPGQRQKKTDANRKQKEINCLATV